MALFKKNTLASRFLNKVKSSDAWEIGKNFIPKHARVLLEHASEKEVKQTLKPHTTMPPNISKVLKTPTRTTKGKETPSKETLIEKLMGLKWVILGGATAITTAIILIKKKKKGSKRKRR